MLVTDIEISDYGYCSRSARHMASVQLVLGDRRVSLFCRIATPRDNGVRSRRAAFLAEALRQMKRMPEFRAGHTTLELPDTLVRASPDLA